MDSSRVWLARCQSYEESHVFRAICRLSDDCGLGQAVTDKTVVLKVNAATGGGPDSARSTHPAVVGALVKYVVSRGAARVLVADSGAVYGFTSASLAASGIAAAALAHGGEVVDIDSLVPARIPAATPFDLFTGQPLLDADVLVSVAKFKTHSLTGFTGAVKNLMGVIQGAQKARLHQELGIREFCRVLAQTSLAVRPAYGIIDCIVGMEGNGPSDGRPRQVGLLAASPDLVAVDAVVSFLAGLDPGKSPLLSAAEAAGLGIAHRGRTEVLGDSFEPVKPPFARAGRMFRLPEMFRLPTIVLYRLRERAAAPAITGKGCTGCGRCAADCPTGAIRHTGSRPVIAYGACCRCFHCSSVCPSGTIAVRLNRLLAPLVRGRMRKLGFVPEEGD